MYLYVYVLFSTCTALRGTDWPREFDRAAFERYLDARPAALELRGHQGLV